MRINLNGQRAACKADAHLVHVTQASTMSAGSSKFGLLADTLPSANGFRCEVMDDFHAHTQKTGLSVLTKGRQVFTRVTDYW